MRRSTSISRPQELTADEQLYNSICEIKCEADHLFFTRYFFKVRHNLKFRVNWHHRLIADVVDDVIAGRRKNVVINVSPGSSKTELVVVNFIARGLALNPRARFLHLSGSDSLASLNSANAKEIVTSDEFQRFWPMRIADDASAKKRWNVEINGQLAGGVYATSIGGQVTGFRAGHMAEGFQGAILIDDPVKPEDAFSKSKVDVANRKLVTTVKSRKANPETPIVVIMQRTGTGDPTDFIKGGNLGNDWDFIRIPAVINDEFVDALDEKYANMVEFSERVDGRYSYWPYKEPIQELLQMERGDGIDASGQRISRHVFASQYDQLPKILGGNIIKGADFGRYRQGIHCQIKFRKIFADTAQKAKQKNDRSCFQEWGLGIDGKIYLLDLILGRWEAPELQRRCVAFWAKAKARDTEKYGQLRNLNVEDKVSGTGLIQTVKLPPYNIPVVAIQRNTDKFLRVNDALPYIEAGLVVIPEDAPYTNDFVTENESFTADDTHDFDDQIDPEVDAINDFLQAGNKMKQWEQLGKKNETPETRG